MKKRTCLAGFLAISALGACGEGTPIAGSEPPTMAMTDPEADLPPGSIEVIDLSANTQMPGTRVNAGNVVALGCFAVKSVGRTTVLDTTAFTMVGSANASDVTDIKLFVGQIPAGASAHPTTPRIEFDLTNKSFSFSAGYSAIICAEATIAGGVNRYIQAQINDGDIQAHDLAGHPVPVTLNTGSWPLKMSYISIDVGSLRIDRASWFTSTTLIAGQNSQIAGAFTPIALGEPSRITSTDVFLYLDGTLQASDVLSLSIQKTRIQPDGQKKPPPLRSSPH